MSIIKKNMILLFMVLALLIFALVLNQGAEFSGADGEAQTVITETNPDYTPWFQPLWEPPSGEIESLLFAVQASFGVGFICYYLGFRSGLRRRESEYKCD
ncbi:additional substrate-specific component cbin of cobalt ecf transporter [hydrocarbon metagenome]|uniref:Additional substrate-specific component cbin of cobalt ecf transporter n=1 Tax=hydrocarbon metagenome TaxID=938273 RepID=A0A0W8EA19_9ZZZZ